MKNHRLAIYRNPWYCGSCVKQGLELSATLFGIRVRVGVARARSGLERGKQGTLKDTRRFVPRQGEASLCEFRFNRGVQRAEMYHRPCDDN